MPAMTAIDLAALAVGLVGSLAWGCCYLKQVDVVTLMTRTLQSLRLILLSSAERERCLPGIMLNETVQRLQNSLADCRSQLADSLTKETMLQARLSDTRILGCSGAMDFRIDSVIELTAPRSSALDAWAKIQMEIELRLQAQHSAKLRDRILLLDEELRKASVKKQVLIALHHTELATQRIEKLIERVHLIGIELSSGDKQDIASQRECEAAQMLDRLTKVFSADAIQYLNHRDIRQLQRFLSAATQQMHDSIHGVMCAQSHLVRQVEQNREKIRWWQNRATTGMRNENWNQVKAALEQVQLYTAAIESLLPQVESISAQNSKLIATLAQFQGMEQLLQERMSEVNKS